MYITNNWERLYDGGPGSKHDVVPMNETETAVVVEVNDRPKDHYGEALQGESECSIIFKVGDRYFKKSGYESSYDEERTWNGPVTEVFAEEKTVLAFRSKR